MKPALDGIKVIDVSQVAAVPMAARHLADFGADVIHVENPVSGDSWRGFQAGVSGSGAGSGAPSPINYNWENFNRGKRSLTLDLSKESGQRIIHRMIGEADVFLTNLRLWEREKFALEFEPLKALNPRLIYGSLLGWGREGPDRNSPAYDSLAYWARTGLGYMFTSPGMPPPIDGGAFGDNVAAMGLAFGIMMALYARERTGVGQEVDTSLFHSGIYQASFFIAGTLTTGLDLADWRHPSREDTPNPLVLPYETKDGRWLLPAILQPDRYWSKLCRALGREDLEQDPRFASNEPRLENHADLLHILEDAFRSRTLEEWRVRLTNEGIPFSPYQNFVESVADPQAKANHVFVPVDHPEYGPIEVIAGPVNLSETPAVPPEPAPEFGQHTEEILLESGYTWDEIERFKDEGVIL